MEPPTVVAARLNDLVALADVGLYPACGVCVLKRPDVGAIMKLEQLRHGGLRCLAEAVVGDPAEHADEIHNRGVAYDAERVVATESGLPKRLTADENRQRRRGFGE